MDTGWKEFINVQASRFIESLILLCMSPLNEQQSSIKENEFGYCHECQKKIVHLLCAVLLLLIEIVL